MSAYRPRPQSARFRDADCPAGVLAIYDNGGETFDRYTVFYRPAYQDHRGQWLVGYRCMSEHPSHPQGFGIYGEMRAHDVAAYRHRVYRESAKWSDLPEDVKRAVRADCAEAEA